MSLCILFCEIKSIPESFQFFSELTDGEGRAGFVDALEFAMANDQGIGVVYFKRTEQREESLLLGWGTGIFGYAFGIESALVADADGVGVVMAGMGPYHLLRATEVELTVAGNVVVVAAAFPATGLVHLVEIIQRQVLVRARCRAVNDNKVYSSHLCLSFIDDYMQDCMRKVDTKAVMTVRMKLPILSAGMFLKILIAVIF